jgi:hypothetical protein
MVAQTVEEKETSPEMVEITVATTEAGHTAVEVRVVAQTVLPTVAPPGVPTVVVAARTVATETQTIVQTVARMEAEGPTLTVTSGRVAVMAPPEVRVGRVSRARSPTRRRITLATESVV